MFKKRDLLKYNYENFHRMEDYYLWIRMYQNGAIFRNIPDNLVYVRVGKEMYNRRGGYKYFKSETIFLNLLYNDKSLKKSFF